MAAILASDQSVTAAAGDPAAGDPGAGRRAATLLRVAQDELVRETVRRLYGREEDGDPAAVAGRAACERDLGHHVRFLVLALEAGTAEPFAAYLVWLRQVLESRGIDAASLAASAEILGEVAGARLAGAEADAVGRVIQAGILALDRSPQAGESPQAGDDDQGQRTLPCSASYLEALLRGDRRHALAVCREARAAGLSPLKVAVGVVQPALYRIGDLWQANRIGIAQEHLATAISQHVLAALTMEEEGLPPHGGSCVLACVAGNRHGLGLRMVADGLELAGWRVRYLGADTPGTALLRELEREPAEVLALSASLPEHVADLRELVAECRTRLGRACPRILVGGLILNRLGTDRTRHLVAADLVAADALEAVELLAAHSLPPASALPLPART